MPSTKLSAYCSKVIEAGWIAAMVLVPLYFNVYSSRVFEPDKLTLLRSIAVFMSAAWIIKLIEEASQGKRVLRFSWRTPLVWPTLALVVIYLFTTVTSVTRFTSLWGSYQRLQGTYTTLSYIVIFFLILNEMRQREQLERLITAAIITSVPISLYGLIQHYGIDPLPWGGDVTRRVASNMGNAIFISAYIIMIFFLTLGRIVESFVAILTDEDAQVADILRAAAYIFTLLIQFITIYFSQSRGPWVGLAVGIFAFTLFGLLSLRRAAEDKGAMTLSDLALAGGAVLGLALLGVLVGMLLLTGAQEGGMIKGLDSSKLRTAALWIGAIVGGAALFPTLVAVRRTWKWLWLGWVIEAALVIGFFILLNLPQTPLEPLRDLPYIGRLGKVFQTERGTGKVRVLIWEGAVDMVTPHDPLGYPTKDPSQPFQTDKLNFLRPLIGYGPESMYVGYNPFYPPDLVHYEKRNASPDRSHNETFDALVITGVVGLVGYLLLFGSVFYYGLKWMGWIDDKRQRNIWLGLFVGGGVLGSVVLMAWQGVEFFGVGLPFGMAGGLVLYLVVYASFLYQPSKEAVSVEQEQPLQAAAEVRTDRPIVSPREMLLVALLSAIMAHFVEIHFGIAIAATRTYFWVYAALLILVGRDMLEQPAAVETAEGALVQTDPAGAPPKTRRQRRRRSRRAASQQRPQPARFGLPAWLGLALTSAFILALVMGTLGFDFVTNAGRINVRPSGAPESTPGEEVCDPQGLRMLVPCWISKAWEIAEHDLTVLPARGRQRPEDTNSLMTLGLLLLALLIGNVLTLSESRLGRSVLQERWQRWWRMMPLLLLDALFMMLCTALILLVPFTRDWLWEQRADNWWWVTLLLMAVTALLTLLVLFIQQWWQSEQSRDWKRVALILELDVVLKIMLVLGIQALGWSERFRPPSWGWIILLLVGVAAYLTLLILDFVDWLRKPQMKYWLPEMIRWGAIVVTLVVLLSIADRHLQLGRMQRTVSQSSLVKLISDLLDVSMYLSSILLAFYAFVFLFILAGGLALLIGQRLPKLWGTPWGAMAAVPLCILALVIMNQTNLKVIRADVVYKQGEEWSRQKQWDLAIAHHKRALELAPNEDFYYLWAGSAYLEKSKSAPAENCVVTGEPNISAVLSMSVEDTAQLCREDLLMAARTILLQARRVNPLNTDHTANLGRLYKNWADISADRERRGERIDQSIGFYQQATTLSPQNTIVWNELATVYLYQKRDLEKAQQAVQRSLELDDRYEQTYLIQGDLLLTEAEALRRELLAKQQELNAAAEDQRVALQAETDRLQAEWKQTLEMAIGSYTEALELNRRLVNVYLTIANANEQMGRLEEAVRVLEEAAAANPRSAEPHVNLAEMYLRYDNPEAAVVEYRQAVTIKPNNVNYRLNLASLLDNLGRLNEALIEVQEAARLKPDDPSLRQNLAFMYQRLEMYPEALAEARTAAQLAPNDPTPQLLIGDISRMMNDLQTATAAYEQALALAPDMDNAWNVHLNLALLYQRSGQLDVALTHAQTALNVAPADRLQQINDFIVQLEVQRSGNPL